MLKASAVLDRFSLPTQLSSSSFGAYGGIKGVVFVFGKACLFAAVLFCKLIGENYKESAEDSIPAVDLGPLEQSASEKQKVPLESFSAIASSSLFGKVKTDATPRAPTQPASPLKLRLVAINEISSGNRLAIIEDTQKQTQEVFELNDTVFSNQGKISAILSDSVRIDHDGRIETLVLQDDIGSGGGTPTASGSAPSDDETDFSVADDELSSALANLPQLLSQARAVPYFRNGQSIGMRLFAIRSGSMYEKLGLKNGDIILSVNQSSLSDPAQALKLFEQLKSERSIEVKLERNGQAKDMHYTIR